MRNWLTCAIHNPIFLNNDGLGQWNHKADILEVFRSVQAVRGHLSLQQVPSVHVQRWCIAPENESVEMAVSCLVLISVTVLPMLLFSQRGALILRSRPLKKVGGLFIL